MLLWNTQKIHHFSELWRSTRSGSKRSSQMSDQLEGIDGKASTKENWRDLRWNCLSVDIERHFHTFSSSWTLWSVLLPESITQVGKMTLTNDNILSKNSSCRGSLCVLPRSRDSWNLAAMPRARLRCDWLIEGQLSSDQNQVFCSIGVILPSYMRIIIRYYLDPYLNQPG